MAFPKLSVVILLLSLIAMYAVADVVNAPAPGSIDCKGECARRCKLSSRPNLCKRACGSCCYRCKCVPPGTYGNKEVCPCYATMTTREGKSKCP